MKIVEKETRKKGGREKIKARFEEKRREKREGALKKRRNREKK